ncbi:hypothetical protein JXR01_00355 [Candidatus Kaiserbacteria bacterium]|nr:MAG: hypothetical protein JXR01_00355 [Candidatus Kaiserbacteria bacterium]
MKHIVLQKNIHMQPDEKMLLVVRKHWFVQMIEALPVILVGIVPFILVIFLAPYISVHPALATFLTAVWLLVIWMMIFTIWTNYYLDIWIVTDKRIININQLHLFRREVSTLRIERVQDIKVETHGFFATLFSFGNLQVQTAGPEAAFYLIEGIPHASQVRNSILERVDMVTEHKSELEYNTEERPPEGV